MAQIAAGKCFRQIVEVAEEDVQEDFQGSWANEVGRMSDTDRRERLMGQPLFEPPG